MLFSGRFGQTSKQIGFLAAGTFVEYNRDNEHFSLSCVPRVMNTNPPFRIDTHKQIFITKVQANRRIGRRRTVFKSDIFKTALGYIVDLRRIYEKDPVKHKDKLSIIELFIHRYKKQERQKEVCFWSLPKMDAPDEIELSRNLLFLAAGTILIKSKDGYSYTIKDTMFNYLYFYNLNAFSIEKAFIDLNWDSIKGTPVRVDLFHDVDNNKLSQSMLIKKLKYLSKGMPYAESIISVLECRYEESPTHYTEPAPTAEVMRRVQPFLG